MMKAHLYQQEIKITRMTHIFLFTSHHSAVSLQIYLQEFVFFYNLAILWLPTKQTST